jgi:fermentation-respiration switch protein FrsA (DUF1100 family)
MGRSWTGFRAGGARPRLLLATVVAASLLAGCSRPEPGAIPLRVADRELVEESATERLYGVRFEDAHGNPVSAFLREPTAAPAAGEGYGAIVLAAGRYAGRQAAALIPGPLDQVVLAVEYPDDIPRRITLLGWTRRLPSFMRSARRMPGILRGAGHHLAAHPLVDRADITLVGVSFGVPFAAAAGHDRVFTGVALHFGGADLAGMIHANLPVRNEWVRSAFSRFGAWVFRDLEPARHVGRISPTPLLIINGTDDEQIPHASAMLLANRASPPVRQIWLEHGHLSSADTHLLRELADSTFRHFRHLRSQRVEHRAGPPVLLVGSDVPETPIGGPIGVSRPGPRPPPGS